MLGEERKRADAAPNLVLVGARSAYSYAVALDLAQRSKIAA